MRKAVREDEPCIIQMWMHQLLRHSFPRSEQTPRPKPGSDEHIAFWRHAQPVIEGLLRSAHVTAMVACVPGRAEYEPGQPAVVCGWALYDGVRIYGVGLKRKYLPVPEGSAAENAVLRDIGGELARATLGALLDEERHPIMPLFDLHRLGLKMPLWTRDQTWLSTMADVSRVIANDAVSADVSRHVLDPRREAWVINEQRAA